MYGQIFVIIPLAEFDNFELFRIILINERYWNSHYPDYYPTNFVARDGILYYIDFECNEYMEQWNYENWGCKYWYKTPEFREAFGL